MNTIKTAIDQQLTGERKRSAPRNNDPAALVEHRAVDSLIPYARNARTHSPEQIAQLAASIREWGWTTPVLIDPSGQIIAGHGRVAAARQLGITEVPVLVADGWSDAKRRAYVLADNKLAMNAGWDAEMLALELGELTELGVGLDLIGFSDEELQAIFAGQGNPGKTDPDQVPTVTGPAVSQPGDVWNLGKHRIICGDSTSADVVSRLLGDVRPSLMVTDPPYGVEYDPKWRARLGENMNPGKLGLVANDDRADWREAWALFPGDVVYCWHAGRRASEVQASLEAADFEIRCQIVWAKDRFALSRGHYHWQHEPCWYAVRKNRGGHWSGDRKQSTLWEIKSRDDSGWGHGTQKPVECMARPVRNSSSPGQAIYEPFSGSGTTIIACEMEGRICYAVELEPIYVDTAVKRWQEFTGEKALLDGTTKTFDEVAGDRPSGTATPTG
jgi:DNA modification methylase